MVETDLYDYAFTSDVFSKILNLNEYDDVYATEGQYVLNLDNFFITEEVTTWRDSYAFLDSLSSVCMPLMY